MTALVLSLSDGPNSRSLETNTYKGGVIKMGAPPSYFRSAQKSAIGPASAGNRYRHQSSRVT